MNKTKIAYWTSTGLFSLLMFAMGVMYFVSPQVAQNIQELGFPDFFRIELGIAKIVGAILLLIPFRGRINDWVYAGFTIDLASASIAHFANGDPATNIGVPLVFLVILGISYYSGRRRKKI